MSTMNESIVEGAALDWFEALGYARTNGLLIAPGEPASERDSFREVILRGRLRDAIRRLNTLVKKGARHTIFQSLRPACRFSLFRQKNRASAWFA